MTDNTAVAHATFVIERHYDADPARVFAAFADPVAKRRWFLEGDGWEILDYSLDFRIGGIEESGFSFKGSPRMGNTTFYHDIRKDERLVFSYSMTNDGKAFSGSLVTIEIKPEKGGTTLTYTEQGAHFDGFDNPGQREEGCRELLEKLAQELAGELV